MNFIQKNSGVIAAVALVIAIVGVFTPFGQSVVSHFGGVTNYDELDATAIKVGGTNGSRVGPIITGTCNLTGGDTAQAASTTKEYICSATGVAAGDKIFVGPATTSSPAITGFGMLEMNPIGVATTSNQFGVGIYNSTGASVTLSAPGPFSGFGSSTTYYIVHSVSSVPGL